MNDSMWNKTAIYDGKKRFLLFLMLKIHNIYFRNIWEPKKSEYSNPPLVLPVNLWHDSWTERAPISTLLKPPLPPEAQFYSLYFSKSKCLKLLRLTVHSREDHPLFFYCACCFPLTSCSDPKTPSLLSHTCSRKKPTALHDFFSWSHLICISRERIYCVPLVRNSCYLG